MQQAASLPSEQVFGLARAARSRGVRVLKSAEETARRKLRPDHEDDGLQVIGNWEVCNWFVGAVAKQDVCQVLSDRWKIRPLFSKVANGARVWTVAAEQDPPENIMEILVDASGSSRMLEIHKKGRKAAVPSRMLPTIASPDVPVAPMQSNPAPKLECSVKRRNSEAIANQAVDGRRPS